MGQLDFSLLRRPPLFCMLSSKLLFGIALPMLNSQKTTLHLRPIYGRHRVCQGKLGLTEKNPQSPIRGRMKELRDALPNMKTWEDMALALRETVGVKTRSNQISAWKRKDPEPAMLAAISHLHPRDPTACLKWLREGGAMPRIHEDGAERTPVIGQPSPADDCALRAMADEIRSSH